MDGSTLTQIRDLLLDRRNKIDTSIERDRTEGAKVDLAAAQAEIIDLAQAIEQLDRDKSLAEQERRELAAIERALAKIATGSFGVCEDCEEDIPSRRLMVQPSARLCAKCQAFEEKQSLRMRAVAR